MSVVGIDFGDENLTIACARRAGIDVLQNEVGKRKTRSGFCCHHVHRHIGAEFPGQFQSQAANSLIFLKRIIGKMFNDPEVQHEQQFMYSKLVEDENGRVAVQARHLGKDVIITPEQAVAVLLKRLKETYELNSEGSKMKDCVVSVPAYFNDAQRRAMLDAIKIAGLNPLRLLNETTAVALQYGTGRKIEDGELRRVVFYDMGVASTDVALIAISNKGLKVERFASDRLLGGRDFDELIAKFLNEQIKTKYKIDAYSTPKSLIKLRKEADRIKQILSANTKVPYTIEYLLDGVDVSGIVNRDEFEKLLDENYKERILAPLQKILKDIPLEEIHSIELLGGSTRVPYVQALLKDFFGRDLSKTCDADESVCRGATLQCAMISPSFKVRDYDIQDLSPYVIGVQWSEQEADSINVFTEYNKVPSVKAVTIKTATLPFQFKIRYAESDALPPTDRTIANVVVNAPPGFVIPEGHTPITMKFKLDANCVVIPISATVTTTRDVIVEEEITEEVPAVEATEEAATPVDATVETPKSEGETEAETPKDEGETAEQTMSDETTTDAPATPATPTTVVKKVKVTRQENVTLDCPFTFIAPFNLTPESFRRACDQEVDMSSVDRLVQETNEARNAFEAYILTMRPRATSDLASYFAPGAADKFVELCNKEELWLEDDGYDESKEVYQQHLEELRAVGEVAVEAANEASLRPQAIEQLVQLTNECLARVDTTEDRYSHITPEERNEVRKRANDILSWVAKVQAQQAALEPYQTPAFKASECYSKADSLIKYCNTTMNRIRPAPKPKAAPKPTPAPETQAEPEAPKAEPEAEKEADSTEKAENEAGDDMKDETEAPATEKTEEVAATEETPKMSDDTSAAAEKTEVEAEAVAEPTVEEPAEETA